MAFSVIKIARILPVLILLASGLSSADPAVPPVGQEEKISADQLRKEQLQETSPLVLDARGQNDFHAAHIEGAVLPLADEFYRQSELYRLQIVNEAPDVDESLKNYMQTIPKDTAIVTYCSKDCPAAAVLLFKLKELGFKNVRVMEEGIQAWIDKGYPVVLQ